jgi:hypothetical protein
MRWNETCAKVRAMNTDGMGATRMGAQRPAGQPNGRLATGWAPRDHSAEAGTHVPRGVRDLSQMGFFAGHGRIHLTIPDE